ncbi:hypothetical protein RJT34_18138 [Clitoria ternatea]|uniref:Uncharacterized protein n=1 Tax=Clitoria ternatea TaxID=43366 RepID=A0AAN9PDZ1_CLITE
MFVLVYKMMYLQKRVKETLSKSSRSSSESSLRQIVAVFFLLSSHFIFFIAISTQQPFIFFTSLYLTFSFSLTHLSVLFPLLIYPSSKGVFL